MMRTSGFLYATALLQAISPFGLAIAEISDWVEALSRGLVGESFIRSLLVNDGVAITTSGGVRGAALVHASRDCHVVSRALVNTGRLPQRVPQAEVSLELLRGSYRHGFYRDRTWPCILGWFRWLAQLMETLSLLHWLDLPGRRGVSDQFLEGDIPSDYAFTGPSYRPSNY